MSVISWLTLIIVILVRRIMMMRKRGRRRMWEDQSQAHRIVKLEEDEDPAGLRLPGNLDSVTISLSVSLYLI